MEEAVPDNKRKNNLFCHMCGTQISEGAAFCHHCGTKVVYEDSMDVQQKALIFNDELTGDAEDKFNAILSKVGLDRVHTVKAVREWTGIEPEEAEELFEKDSTLLKKNVTFKEAKEIRAAFAKERAEITFTDTKGRSVDIEQWESCDNNEKRTWKEKLLWVIRFSNCLFFGSGLSGYAFLLAVYSLL